MNNYLNKEIIVYLFNELGLKESSIELGLKLSIEKNIPYCIKWVSNDLKHVYENAIKHYIPDNNWRLVP